MNGIKSRHLHLLAVLLIALAVVCVAPFLGITSISVQSILNIGGLDAGTTIFWKMRVPRVMLAFLAGAALSLGGLVFQSIFRNPLATPFTLGVSSGASLGAMLYFRFGLAVSTLQLLGSTASAFIGAILTIVIVLGVASVSRSNGSNIMLLTGVALSFFFSSLIIFIQYVSNFSEIFRITRWLMGGFETIGPESVLEFLPFFLVGLFIISYRSRELNLLSLGDELAASRGVAVVKIRNQLLFGTSLLIGAVVSLCGPIGFVGIIVPHICRLFVGYDHVILVPLTAVFGGTFLVVCDTIARIAVAPSEIPVGVITALLGGPFFVWLLISRKDVGVSC